MTPVTLLGGYPPPYGGITVHVQRLQRLLAERYDCTVLDMYSAPLPEPSPGVVRCGARAPWNLARTVRHLTRLRPRLAHFHVSTLGRFWAAGPALLAALPRRARRLISLHSGGAPAAFAALGRVKRRLTVRSLLRFDRCVAVGPPLADFLLELGVPRDRIAVISSFLPPAVERDERLAEAVRRLRSRAGHVFLLSGYARRYYGYHVFLDALARLPAQVRRRVGFVFAWYSGFDEAYVAELTGRMPEEVPHLLVRDLPPGRFAFLLGQADTYVRPTFHDGDGVAMREAAFFGRQVVASDAAPRPRGAATFRSEDAADLARALLEVIGDATRGRFHQDAGANAERLLEVYRDLLAESPHRARNQAKGAAS